MTDCHITYFNVRSSSSEVPPKISSRVVRQLKPAALEIDSTSALTQTSRILKDRSPKVVEHRSPRSPVSEVLLIADSTNPAVIA